MNTPNVHFGRLVEDLVRKKGADMDTEAKKWNYEKHHLYKIFKKEDLSTGILKKACDLYHVGWEYFCPECPIRAAGMVDPMEVKILEIENNALKREVQLLQQLTTVLSSGTNTGTNQD